jgi:hypothetical protein
MPKWTGFARDQGIELARLVLLPDVHYNRETWFITRAFNILRGMTVRDSVSGLIRQRFRVVLSYSGPVERRNAVAFGRVKILHLCQH